MDGGLCCILLAAWAILFLVTATLLFFSQWIAAAISGALYAIAFAIWVFICCRRCARTFWRCCTLLQWYFILAVIITSLLFAIYALLGSGNPVVIFIYGLFAALMGILMALAHCSAVNPFDPSTWPSCSCP